MKYIVAGPSVPHEYLDITIKGRDIHVFATNQQATTLSLGYRF